MALADPNVLNLSIRFANTSTERLGDDRKQWVDALRLDDNWRQLTAFFRHDPSTQTAEIRFNSIDLYCRVTEFLKQSARFNVDAICSANTVDTVRQTRLVIAQSSNHGDPPYHKRVEIDGHMMKSDGNQYFSFVEEHPHWHSFDHGKGQFTGKPLQIEYVVPLHDSDAIESRSPCKLLYDPYPFLVGL